MPSIARFGSVKRELQLMNNRRQVIGEASYLAIALGVGLALPTTESEAQPRRDRTPGGAIGVGGEEARDGGLILAGVLNPCVIAGGAQAAASIATFGNGAGRARPLR